MSQFKVGDICIGQNFINHAILNGMECQIIGGLESRHIRNKNNTYFAQRYRVKWSDGCITAAQHLHLRLKKPPRREIDTLTSWELCGWQPKRDSVLSGEK